MHHLVFLTVALVILYADGPGAAEQVSGKESTSYIKIEAKGVLRTGIVAIGGETTGTLIETKDGTLELDFGKSNDLRALASKLNGKAVVVTGDLKIRRGVEVKLRTIVTVATLKPAE